MIIASALEAMSANSTSPMLSTISADEALATIGRVEQLLAEKGLICGSSSAVGSLFAKMRRLQKKGASLSDEKRRILFLQADDAIRIAQAIDESIDDSGAREPIHRVLRNNISLSNRQKSQAKDSLWELELYRRIKLGGQGIRFEEPDLVVSLGEKIGEYAVACKKIYSARTVSERFDDGCKQILTHGRPGIVAINIDDLMPEGFVCFSPNKEVLGSRLHRINERFILANEKHFRKGIERGDCDGVAIFTAVRSFVPNMSPEINIARAAAIWHEGAGLVAKRRCQAFIESIDQLIVKNVG